MSALSSKDTYHTLKSQQYTCPMHPEIILNQPGSCPICGMSLEPKTLATHKTGKAGHHNELTDLSKRFWLSVILSLPILFLTMGLHIPGIKTLVTFIPIVISSYLQLALSSIIIFWCGYPLLKRAWLSLKQRHLNMFTLIGLGISIAYGYSVIAVFFPNLFPAAFHSIHGQVGQVNLYFETASVITALVLMGQILELKGREQTGGALRSLLDLSPKTARRIKGQTESEIPLDDIQIDDELRVRPGEKIPTDGVIIQGHSSINESMITGEAIPVEKQIGSHVIGGTLNMSGSFVMRAKHVGKTTLLAQIVQLVSEAQRSKAPIQKLADQISSYFVPIVLLIAFITFIAWSIWGPYPAMTYGLIAAISVLIIACPCALGLATPMSITVGMGRGAQAGILIKDAESLERFEKVNALVVDKTGTLTLGKPVVNHIIAAPGFTETEVLLVAASLEKQSEHPLANAVVNAAEKNQLHLDVIENFSAEIGIGVFGLWQNKSIALGNQKLCNNLKISTAIIEKQAIKLRQAGETIMYLVIEKQLAGFISVSDPIKESTLSALNSLRKQGLTIIMVTGDNRISAEAVAKKLAIKQVEAEILPSQKNKLVKQLQKQGYIVAMAGDGINDAPALAQADIGIAMGTGTDVAMQNAGVTLVKGDLMGIVHAQQLSKQVMRNIRENLFLAFIYNILCIPIAAGVLYAWNGRLLDPMFAALAMSLSSLSVIGNSLRLRTLKINR